MQDNCIPVPVLRAYEVASVVSSPSWRPVWDFGVVSQLGQMHPGDSDQPESRHSMRFCHQAGSGPSSIQAVVLSVSIVL